MLAHPILPYTVTTVADYIHTCLDQAAVTKGKATLAIPGGRSPGPLLTALSMQCSDFVRKHLHLFWVDERAVPVGHVDRNDLGGLAAWNEGGASPAGVHVMPAEAEDLEAAAAAYGSTMREQGAEQGFDVCLLGIGEDGHFASCFPNHPLLDDLGPVFAIADSPKPPAKRLSVALPVINASSNIVVLALGAEKGDRIADALKASDKGNPVSLLPAERTRVFCDDAALARATS